MSLIDIYFETGQVYTIPPQWLRFLLLLNSDGERDFNNNQEPRILPEEDQV